VPDGLVVFLQSDHDPEVCLLKAEMCWTVREHLMKSVPRSFCCLVVLVYVVAVWYKIDTPLYKLRF